MATTQSKTYTLDEYYTDQEKKLAQARDEKKRQANLSSMKLQKYLGNDESLARQGYSQGMTETARIAAENSRQKALAAADNDYTDSYSNLMNQYRVEKEAEQDKKEAKQDKAYEELMGQIDSTDWKDADSLQKYLYGEDKTLNEGDIAYGLRDEQLKNIELREKDIVGAFEKEKEVHKKDVEIGGYLNNLSEGNNFKIDGYEVELGALVVSVGQGQNINRSALPSDVLEKTSDGEIFEYKGQLYYRKNVEYGNGMVYERIYRIRGRGNKQTDDYANVVALFTD